ncbi:hypothetical protein ACNKHU_12190 [Shigella flexneri]
MAASINYRYYPQEARAKGENEAALAARIHSLFQRTEDLAIRVIQCGVLIDEVTCNVFYRNFYDPYAWSWQHDNSRWDLLDVMRACYACARKE